MSESAPSANAVVPGPEAPLTRDDVRSIFREEFARSRLEGALIKPWWAHIQTWSWLIPILGSVGGMVLMSIGENPILAQLPAPWNALVPLICTSVAASCAKGLQSGRERAQLPGRELLASLPEAPPVSRLGNSAYDSKR